MNKHIYWLGIRESEIASLNDLFYGSVTIFGSGTRHNYSFDKEYQQRYDYNLDNERWNSFLAEKVSKIIEDDPDSFFMAYDNMDIPICRAELRERMICQNSAELLSLLNNKFLTRSWLKACANIPPYAIMSGGMISVDELKKLFPGFNEFVVQGDYSCGGSATWLYSKDTRVSPHFNTGTKYAVSPYFRNSVSINVHLVIYESEILILPASIQIISTRDGNFSYQGADFVAYQQLLDSVKEELQSQAMAIGTQLRLSGYRGVCGIDFIAAEEALYFMEVNARFQSSTFLLNRALEKFSGNLSVQKLHLDAFENKSCTVQMPEFQVEESFYHYAYDPAYKKQLQALMRLAPQCPEVSECINDDLDCNMDLCKHTYLYKLVFHTNICSVAADFICRLHPNVSVYSDIGDTEELEDPNNLLSLKIMLLNQGIRVNENVIEQVCYSGGLNYEEFSALDVSIPDRIFMNVPYKVKLSQLSPFCIEKLSDHLVLTHWGMPITDVHLRGVDQLGSRHTKTGFRYDEISYLCNDRLRIYERLGCYFKQHQAGCRFCDIVDTAEQFTLSDLEEILDAYADHPQIRHFMIGGGSFSPSSDFHEVIQMAKLIHARTEKPIYLMTLPPMHTEILHELKEAGVTEIAMNLEVFDRSLARRFMPGKGSIPSDIYKEAFQEAVRLWGSTGRVRTIFIVGLEPRDSLLKGVELVCSMGVSPILSLFKPIEGTPMSQYLPPSNCEVYEITKKVMAICERHHVPLGPTCHYCEDNTLKISPQKNELKIADIL